MPKKIDNYKNEREEIKNKFIQILNLQNDNDEYSLIIDNINNEQQQNILNLETDIRKYFICGNWSCIRRKDLNKRWLSFVKYVFRDTNHNIKIAYGQPGTSKKTVYYFKKIT